MVRRPSAAQLFHCFYIVYKNHRFCIISCVQHRLAFRSISNSIQMFSMLKLQQDIFYYPAVMFSSWYFLKNIQAQAQVMSKMLQCSRCVVINLWIKCQFSGQLEYLVVSQIQGMIVRLIVFTKHNQYMNAWYSAQLSF